MIIWVSNHLIPQQPVVNTKLCPRHWMRPWSIWEHRRHWTLPTMAISKIWKAIWMKWSTNSIAPHCVRKKQKWMNQVIITGAAPNLNKILLHKCTIHTCFLPCIWNLYGFCVCLGPLFCCYSNTADIICIELTDTHTHTIELRPVLVCVCVFVRTHTIMSSSLPHTLTQAVEHTDSDEKAMCTAKNRCKSRLTRTFFVLFSILLLFFVFKHISSYQTVEKCVHESNTIIKFRPEIKTQQKCSAYPVTGGVSYKDTNHCGTSYCNHPAPLLLS